MKLHALGYVSGVYSSGASGIADLADEVGTGYALPDNIWVANWNGQATATDPYLPANGWTQHQRIHQYRGGHDESYGGVTINIDNNYVDGGTVGTAASTTTNEDPVGSLDLVGSPTPGQVRVKGWAFDLSAPTEPLAIRAYIGGRPGAPSAVPYDLGVVANQARARRRRQVPARGRQPRLRRSPSRSSSRGRSRSASTRSTPAAAPTTCSAASRPRSRSRSPSRSLKTTARSVKVWAACEWPAGTELPRAARPPHPGQDRASPPPRHAAADPRRHPLARAPRLPPLRQAGPRLRDPAQRRRPGAAAAARQAQLTADRGDPRRPPHRRRRPRR